MKILLFILLIVSSSLNAQWYVHPFKISSVEYNDIFFIENYGWIVGTNGTILSTSDKGLNWIQQAAPTTKKLKSVFFLNNRYGYIVGDSGTFLKTSNRGEEWVQQQINFQNDLYNVQFIDSLNGFISGRDLVIKSTDGGASWSYLFNKSDYFYGMYWLNKDTGFIATDTIIQFARTALLKTTNGGTNWYTPSLEQFNELNLYYEIKFKDNVGYVLGEDFLIWKSTDFGESWKLKTQPFASNYYSIDFIDTSYIWAVGKTSIKYSSNGGSNWNEQNILNRNFVDKCNSIWMFDSLNGFIVGLADADTSFGLILTTSNGGITSISENTKNVDKNFSIECYPNPFNTTTTICYSLLKSGFTTLKVYDILGREITTLVNEDKSEGSYLIEYNASKLSSGVYFYSLTTGSFSMNKKMILMK
ncbi:MAG TPA: YCF48-related protein [Ignavibacteriaceae bacterium]|nr:YCF48-related protein [Ignavibacteriaceae bacterium]